MNLPMNMKPRRRAFRAYPVCLLLLCIALAACERDYPVDERLERAAAFVAEHDDQSAIIELKHALRTDSGSTAAARMLGEIYVRIGDGPSAEKELARALEKGADDFATRVLLAEAMLLQAKYEQVLQEAQWLAEDAAPGAQARVHVLRGAAHLGMREPGRAAASYAEALALDASSLAAMIGLARTELAEGRYEQAESQLAAAERVSPDDVELWITRGSLELARSLPAEAAQAFDGAIARIRTRGMTEQRFRALLGLATAETLLEEFADAEKHLGVLNTAAPGHPQVAYLTSWLAYQRGDYEKARTGLMQVELRAPSHLPTQLLLGAVHYALGSYEQANIHLTRFVSAAPGHVQGRKLLGATRLRLNRASEAIDVLTPAVAEAEQDAQLLTMIGRAAAQAGDPAREIDFLRRASRAAPDDPAIRTGIARAYLQQGATEEAIKELESIAAGASGDRESRMLLIGAHIGKGDFDAARDVADELVREAPEDPAPHVVRGGIELTAGRRDEARGHYEAALALVRDYPPAHLALGRMDLEDEGRLDEAKRHFEQALSADAGSVAAMTGLARVADRQGERQQAVSWLEQAGTADASALLPRLALVNHYLEVRDFPRALAIAKEATQAHPEAPDALHALARAQAATGDLRDADRTYGRLTRLHPQPLAYLERAAIQVRLGDQGAYASFQRALELDAGLLPAKVGLAVLDRAMGRRESAFTMAQRIQREHPDAAAGFSLAGELYLERGDTAKARAAFAQALEREPTPQTTLRVTQAWLAMGNSAQAVTTLEQGLSRHPGAVVLRTTLGAVHQQEGRTEAAQAEYERALALDPANVVALNNGALLSLGRDDEKALRLAREAWRLAPGSPQVADTFGWVQVRTGSIAEGLKILEGLSARKEPGIRYHYAAALAMAGREPEARTVLQALLEADAAFPERDEARELLRSLPGSGS